MLVVRHFAIIQALNPVSSQMSSMGGELWQHEHWKVDSAGNHCRYVYMYILIISQYALQPRRQRLLLRTPLQNRIKHAFYKLDQYLMKNTF